jgi:Putative zinc-finger
VSLLHGRWRKRVSLLASGALSGRERDETLAHVSACARCRREQAGLDELLELVALDPLRGAEPPLPASALAARVRARLSELEPAPSRRAGPAWLLWPGLAAAALLVAVLALPRGRSTAPVPTASHVEPTLAAVPDEMLARLERNLTRQHAARYLSEAQAVLVNVASPPHCDREDERVDVEDEARRSRELLTRRALLVELDGEPVMSARPVLEDVDTMLREVAALPACARPRDLDAIQRELERRRLLMKIDLMTQELLG